MLTTLITLIVAILLLAVLWYALGLLPLPEPVRTIILIIAALLVLLYVFRGFL